MSEFLAASGCRSVGTSINQDEVETARHRIEVFARRELDGELAFEETAMETVGEHFSGRDPFDFVFVHAALHHAFSWQETLASVASVLRPAGWLLICNEPNLLHTLQSYRISKLDHTHEIGMSRRAIHTRLLESGFDRVENYSRPGLFKPIWLAARRR